MVFKSLFSAASPAGAKGRLSILIFHRVLAQSDPIFPGEVCAKEFDAICGWLRQWFMVLPLDEAVHRLACGGLPQRALAITFDDGYADNHAQALPILQRHGLTSTFFIASAFLDGGRMFNDSVIEAVRGADAAELDLRGLAGADLGRLDIASPLAKHKAIATILRAVKYRPQAERDSLASEIAQRARAKLPDDLMLTSAQVRALRDAGMQIGAHTQTHPILARLDRAAARNEIVQGKRDLESILEAPVTLFAYPNGKPGEDYGSDAVALVREAGFAAAVSTAWGAAGRHSDPFQLPRFTPWDRTRWRFGIRMARNLLATSVALTAEPAHASS